MKALELRRLRKALKNSNYKPGVYVGMMPWFYSPELTPSEKLDLIDEFCNDDEKIKIFKTTCFDKSQPIPTLSLIELIKDENMRLDLYEAIQNDPELSEIILPLSDNADLVSAIRKLSNESKVSALLEHNYNFKVYEIIDILSSMDVDFLMAFLKKHKDFLVQKDIKPYEITRHLGSEKQLDFIKKLKDAGLTTRRK